MPVNKKDLAFRTLSGVIIGPIAVFSFLTYQSLLGLVTTIIILASYEFIEMSNKEIKNNFIKLLYAFVIGVASLLYGFSLKTEYAGILPFEAEIIFFIAFVFIASVSLFTAKDQNEAKNLITSSVFAIMYISFFLSIFYNIHIGYGGTMGILALTSVWAYDACAYFFGLNFGKHKLSPKFSPKKTWEGFFGGVLGTFVYILIYEFFRELYGFAKLDIFYALIFAVMVACFDTVGDLTESIFKRFYGVKDSGEVLPGHGGMLDRIDGLLVVTPMWYLFLRILGI
ncbi:MAG TPA: phosphatidate cytidylyltransferase [Petrotogaceae bacterium]|nr:phosphatidate cytidylyltransferase [Petrotogaceae bacterium]